MESKQEECECNGTYLIDDGEGGKCICRCFIKKYMQSKLDILGIKLVLPESRKFASTIDLDETHKIVIQAKERDIEDVKGVIACLWVRQDISLSLVSMNCYRLVDIYLGKDLEYPNLPYIIADILVLFIGYNEFKNSRIPNFILHMLEARRDKINWLVYKDPKEEMGPVNEYLKINGYRSYKYTGKSNMETYNMFDR